MRLAIVLIAASTLVHLLWVWSPLQPYSVYDEQESRRPLSCKNKIKRT